MGIFNLGELVVMCEDCGKGRWCVVDCCDNY